MSNQNHQDSSIDSDYYRRFKSTVEGATHIKKMLVNPYYSAYLQKLQDRNTLTPTQSQIYNGVEKMAAALEKGQWLQPRARRLT